MSFRIRTMLALLFALGAVTVTVGMIAALGSAVWQDDGVEVCGAANEQGQPQAVSDGAGGAIITWEDTREQGISDYDIYAQRVDADGNPLERIEVAFTFGEESTGETPKESSYGIQGDVHR